MNDIWYTRWCLPSYFALKGRPREKGGWLWQRWKRVRLKRTRRDKRAGDVERLEFVKVHVKWHEPLGKGLGSFFLATEVRITMNDCSALLYGVVRRAQLSPAIKSTSARTDAEKRRLVTMPDMRMIAGSVWTRWEETLVFMDMLRSHQTVFAAYITMAVSFKFLIIKNYNPRITRAFVLHNYPCAAWSPSPGGKAGVTRFHSFLICSWKTSRAFHAILGSIYSKLLLLSI